MIFLLGGPPRVGKSIISGKIQQKHAVSVVSTDSLGAALEVVLSPEAQRPVLSVAVVEQEFLVAFDHGPCHIAFARPMDEPVCTASE